MWMPIPVPRFFFQAVANREKAGVEALSWVDGSLSLVRAGCSWQALEVAAAATKR